MDSSAGGSTTLKERRFFVFLRRREEVFFFFGLGSARKGGGGGGGVGARPDQGSAKGCVNSPSRLFKTWRVISGATCSSYRTRGDTRRRRDHRGRASRFNRGGV